MKQFFKRIYYKTILAIYYYTQKKAFEYISKFYPSFKYDNPIEIVYSALLKTYSNIHSLQIIGIEVQPKNTITNTIVVNITLKRPGFLIGLKGQDINRLEDILTKDFNVDKVSVMPFEPQDKYGLVI